MSGIYFHIPFCKVRCSYCDFYKTTNTSRLTDLVRSLKLELWLRRDYLTDYHIKTIYFGGGTPSLLAPDHIEDLIRACSTVFKVDSEVEITIEANPDDLSVDYLKVLHKIGINRISIGIQSFAHNDLKLMKRRHNSIQALNAVKFSREAGFTNISVDLIYGIPNMSLQQWNDNLKQIFDLDIQHLSAYHLTYHEGTKIWDDLKKKKIKEITEDESVKQFELLIKMAEEYDFKHYEISNFAREGYFSKHNSSYWKQTEYLGLGPSAHSYNKVSRQWNVSSLTHYLLALSNQKIPFQLEQLSEKDRFNDYIITSLRTMWGIDLEFVEHEFSKKYVDHVEKIGEKYKAKNQLIVKENKLILDQRCMLISDGIMSDFMILN